VLVTWSQELADRVRAEVVERVIRTRNARARRALDGPQSAIVWSTTLRRPRRSATRTHRSTSNCTSGPASGGLRQCRCGVRRRVFARESRGLPGRQQPRAPDGRTAAVRGGSVGGDVPASAAGHRLRPRCAARGPRDIVALAVAEALPAHGEAVTARFADLSTGSDACIARSAVTPIRA
jgi:histidinol dehydrogenase